MLWGGKSGKKYIKEVTRLLKVWTQDMPMRPIVLKSIQTMPALWMQKPIKISKSRDYFDALEITLQLWESGEIKSLLLEAETIQQRLTSNSNLKSIADI